MPSESENRNVAALRKRVERLDSLIADQQRAIAALNAVVGEIRRALPPPVSYGTARNSHPAVRTGRITI